MYVKRMARTVRLCKERRKRTKLGLTDRICLSNRGMDDGKERKNKRKKGKKGTNGAVSDHELDLLPS